MKLNKYPSKPILLVDDEEVFLQSCNFTLRSTGINNIVLCNDSRKAIPLLKENDFEAVLLDYNMPHFSGKEILENAVQDFPDIPVIMITGVNEIDIAVECMKIGAFDYMVKPVEQSRLVSGVRRAIELRLLQQQNTSLKEHLLSDKLENSQAFSDIITNNEKMRSIFKYLESIAGTVYPVLITGETGVGKELIARAMHSLSGCNGNFVAVNAGGLDDTVFSDTLFGHKKGAFTGAEQPRPGLIEQAAGGSLFLDEIGDLETASQVKLLRLIQEREYYPLGSDVPKKTDARLLVSTNHDLKALQDKGKFRVDLYFRLCTHQVTISPLRERMNDLPLLFEHFLKMAASKLERQKPSYPRELITLLSTYNFPGNIRELQGLIFDAVTRHHKGILSMESFKHYIASQRDKDNFNNIENIGSGTELSPFNISKNGIFPTLKEAENFLVGEALKQAKGNQTIAAEMLGLTRSALNKRLNRSN